MWKKLAPGCLALGLLAAILPALHGELTEEEKKELFLRAREDIHPVPRASATPRPKPKTIATPTPEEEATPTPKPEASPTPKPRATRSEESEEPSEKPEATPTPERKAKKEERDEEEQQPPRESKPKPSEEAKEEEVPKSTPPPQIPKGKTPGGVPLDAPIVIEKSGLDEQQGYEPPPARGFGGWFRRWHYLTPSVRRAIDKAPVLKGRWKYIVVHNSGTRQGNARIFDIYHRRVRKMPNGLAYHFVIGDGHGSGDGEIEIGSRWTRQINGGHVASDYLNNIALGICLVGDLNRDKPTKAQLMALDELITYLRGRVGKIKGKPSIVVPHKMINPKPTDCPGDRFPYSWLKQRFGS